MVLIPFWAAKIGTAPVKIYLNLLQIHYQLTGTTFR